MGFYENYPHLEVFLIHAAPSIDSNIPVIHSRNIDEVKGVGDGRWWVRRRWVLPLCGKKVGLSFDNNKESIAESASEMRLILTTLLSVVLSAVFSLPTAEPPGSSVEGTHDSISPSPASSQQPQIALSFAQFKSRYGKQYATIAEEHFRQHIFSTNLQMLNRHNARPNRSFTMRPNSFLDVERSEFAAIYSRTYPSDQHSWNISNQILRKNGSQASGRRLQEAAPLERKVSILPVAACSSGEKIACTQAQGNISIDWTIYSGKVRFQGTCGACYAFSTVDTFAALNSINYFGFFVPLAIQQVVDCAQNGLTFGCRGGHLEGAYTYIQTYGLTLESSYPYTYEKAVDAGACKLQGGPFRIKSFQPIEEGSCQALIQQLKLGPVSAGISGYNLQYYGEGIFNECSDTLDHAVMIVGYRSGTGWRIKNSWGKDWGEEGFGWIAEGNTCGICTMAVSVRV